MDLKLTLIVAYLLAIASTQDDTCKACNCQFNNVQVLDQLIEAKITNALTNGFFGAGVTFIRWGKSSCPATNGTELVYAGRAGGTHFTIQGGGAEKLCLPENPDYLSGTSNIRATSLPHSPRVYGAEYDFYAGPNTNVLNHNVPCAVCYVSTRAATIMIPAKTECPSSWTREYYGYLTAEYELHYRSSYNCIDVNPEPIGSSGNENGALFYYVASTCTGLDCPPYENDRALSCAVCTK